MIILLLFTDLLECIMDVDSYHSNLIGFEMGIDKMMITVIDLL